MSATLTPSPTPPSDPLLVKDPFFYGRRFDFASRQYVGLSREDAIFPREGDQIGNSDHHQLFCSYLSSVFRYRMKLDQTLFATFECNVDWEIRGVRAPAPDVAAFRIGAVSPPRSNFATIYPAALGAQTECVIEVTSPSTRDIDLEDKIRLYHRVGAPQYVIVDLLSKPRRLLDYRWTPTGFELAPTADRVALGSTGVAIAMIDGELRCWNRATGEELLDFAEATVELDQERQARKRAEAKAKREARARAKAEDAIVHEVEARHRAEAEAKEERAKREALEDRLRELERRLRRDESE